jgi:hypothetical protein
MIPAYHVGIRILQRPEMGFQLVSESRHNRRQSPSEGALALL